MKKTIILALVVLLSSSTWLCAHTGVGSWRSHLAYHNAKQCVIVNDKVYVVSDGSLYSYTPQDEFIECYDKTNLLNDQDIRHIAVDEQSNTLVIIYNNANIDLLRPNGSVTNISDFVNESTLDPTINGVCIVEGKAFLATNFGFTILNVEQEVLENTYILGKKVYSCIKLDDTIYAATTEGLYGGNTHKNLLDITNWTKLNTQVYTQLTTFEEQLLALKSKESVYTIATSDGVPTLFRKGTWNFVFSSNGRLLIGNSSNTLVFDTLESHLQLTFDGSVNGIAADGNTYWTANGAKGLNGYQYHVQSRETSQIASLIIPNSPIRNYCQYLSFTSDGRLLVAGGCTNYFGTKFYDGTLMMYENGTWYSFEEEDITNRTAGRYRNMTSIVQDPLDPNHYYASSFGQGIYEFRDMKFVKQYTHKEKAGLSDVVATPLESAIPSSYEYTRISRLIYDKHGNLWISNADGAAVVKSPLKILKPNGEMISLYYKELEKLPTVTEILFDSSDRVWVISMQNEVRLFCIDLNGTLEDTTDDRIKMFSGMFTDQDGGTVEVYYINDIAEDLNGDIWVMTDKGPYVLYNTEEVFSDDYHFTKIKVPRNDGTNYADYLLDGAYTTCIEIDAANRKWIGTLSTGLYLVGADGLEEVHHFTKDNSPLPSNAIESLALHHPSGELFIGTDKGLMSYVTDATQGAVSYEEENVYAYPNPVVSYYDGLITIVGFKTNTHVKVINTAGQLIAEGTSLGGSFTWDGRTPQGQRVATGVYYVLGCDEEGREGIATKVLFIK